MFKPDFFRLFSIGFAVGAAVVFSVQASGNLGTEIARNVAPTAQAAPAR